MLVCLRSGLSLAAPHEVLSPIGWLSEQAKRVAFLGKSVIYGSIDVLGFSAIF